VLENDIVRAFDITLRQGCSRPQHDEEQGLTPVV
jgi:hypothetical protein